MIIEYEEKYLEDVRDLLVELEEYIVSIDKDNLDQVGPEYREKMALNDLKIINENGGKCYLYVENNKVIGLIMGYLRNYDEIDYLDYKCPKAGIISELIVTSKVRSSGIGRKLMDKLESFFKENNCEYVFVDAFGYNDNAINFYEKYGYHTRMYSMIKKV